MFIILYFFRYLIFFITFFYASSVGTSYSPNYLILKMYLQFLHEPWLNICRSKNDYNGKIG